MSFHRPRSGWGRAPNAPDPNPPPEADPPDEIEHPRASEPKYPDPFAPGGEYDPQNILNSLGDRLRALTPEAHTGNEYAESMMGLAARSAGVASRNASKDLRGMNPYARIAALAQVARGTTQDISQAGQSGMSQGWGMHQDSAGRTHGAQMNMLGQSLGFMNQGMHQGREHQHAAMMQQERLRFEGQLWEQKMAHEKHLKQMGIDAETAARMANERHSWLSSLAGTAFGIFKMWNPFGWSVPSS